MSQVRIPKFLASPIEIWVKCDEVRALSDMETACLIPSAGGEQRLVIVEPDHCRAEERLVRAAKIGFSRSDESNWLVDFPSGQRIMVAEEQVHHGTLV